MRKSILATLIVGSCMATVWTMSFVAARAESDRAKRQDQTFDEAIADNAANLAKHGRSTFRFETFGDEKFFGDTLKLHQPTEGSRFGGGRPGVSPAPPR